MIIEEGREMSKSLSTLEKEWHKWIKARATGSAKGNFPYAEELLEQRKELADFMLNYIPLYPEVDKKLRQWPHPTKRATRRNKRK